MAAPTANVFQRYEGPYVRKAGCDVHSRPLVESKCDYWMGEMVPAATKGSGGAVAATFCQIAPAWLLANERLPVEAKLVGIAVV